jgi:hypothetical protein
VCVCVCVCVCERRVSTVVAVRGALEMLLIFGLIWSCIQSRF